jgi:Asp-tRNA(Asn)/Glu-tRNA(Gln) amidotransferase A subunit family amidase
MRVDGLPTSGGSQLPTYVLAGPESDCVSRLRHAGALILGKTVSTEFAYFEPGPTRNPHNLERTPGGSSSGSAAAIAAGLCPLTLGTQTVGSVIRPGLCGVGATSRASGVFQGTRRGFRPVGWHLSTVVERRSFMPAGRELAL